MERYVLLLRSSDLSSTSQSLWAQPPGHLETSQQCQKSLQTKLIFNFSLGL